VRHRIKLSQSHGPSAGVGARAEGG
jgi:hypothetical protein